MYRSVHRAAVSSTAVRTIPLKVVFRIVLVATAICIAQLTIPVPCDVTLETVTPCCARQGDVGWSVRLEVARWTAERKFAFSIAMAVSVCHMSHEPGIWGLKGRKYLSAELGKFLV